MVPIGLRRFRQIFSFFGRKDKIHQALKKFVLLVYMTGMSAVLQQNLLIASALCGVLVQHISGLSDHGLRRESPVQASRARPPSHPAPQNRRGCDPPPPGHCRRAATGPDTCGEYPSGRTNYSTPETWYCTRLWNRRPPPATGLPKPNRRDTSRLLPLWTQWHLQTAPPTSAPRGSRGRDTRC